MYKHARQSPKHGWTPARRTQSTISDGARIETQKTLSRPDPWLLTAAIPDRLVALANRLNLKPNKAGTCLWSLFEPEDSERERARTIVAALKSAGISFSWRQVNRRASLPSKARHLAHQGKRKRTQAR